MRLGPRLHRHYLQRERLDDLRRLLALARERGYETMTLSAFAGAAAPDRTLLLRHDVDSDVRRARRMWGIERELGMTGTWFFRRCTWDVGFMRELVAAGCEVGYHYEELATLVKRHGVSSADEARGQIDAARSLLRTSLDELRAGSGLELDVLASHGDFANRVVGVSNDELLADRAFRAQAGVQLEAYDVEDRVDARHSDGGSEPPGYWWPADPADAVRTGASVVEVLLHPRPWGRAPLVNARADLHRLAEGCVYGLRRAARRTAP